MYAHTGGKQVTILVLCALASMNPFVVSRYLKKKYCIVKAGYVQGRDCVITIFYPPAPTRTITRTLSPLAAVLLLHVRTCLLVCVPTRHAADTRTLALAQCGSISMWFGCWHGCWYVREHVATCSQHPALVRSSLGAFVHACFFNAVFLVSCAIPLFP